jgi:glycosyltransferase involved in cell wall biosynthesis
MTGRAAEALDRFGEADVLHDNGIWLPHNHRLAVLAARRGIPRVVSTRGMLQPWALSHKWLKKRVAWWVYQQRDLQRASCCHTTAEEEARNVERFRLGVPIVAVPNGVDVPEAPLRGVGPEARKPLRREQRTALFLARIHASKGLPMLIEAWARVRPSGWSLRIVGPDDAGHQRQVEKLVAAAGLADVVCFTGQLIGRMKESAFFDADLFVLPTHSESFGMGIAEALAHGLPVLTTTRAPWSILQERGCGWWVAPTVEGVAEGLRAATCLDSATLQAMGAEGRALVAEQFGWKVVAELILSTYNAVIARHRAAPNSRDASYVLSGHVPD